LSKNNLSSTDPLETITEKETIVTATDAPPTEISLLDISQSATGSVHGNHEEVIDNYAVLAGALAHFTEELQLASTLLQCDFGVSLYSG
jgi:hypothetical protein